MIIEQRNAQLAGLTRYISSRACPKCGCTERYVYDNRCTECRKAKAKNQVYKARDKVVEPSLYGVVTAMFKDGYSPYAIGQKICCLASAVKAVLIEKGMVDEKYRNRTLRKNTRGKQRRDYRRMAKAWKPNNDSSTSEYGRSVGQLER